MFQDLDWRWALKRAAIVVVIYLVLMYVLNTIAPETFGLSGAEEWIPLIMNAVLFFFVFTLVYAFIERSRRRRLQSGGANQSKDRNVSKSAGADENGDPRESGRLKGKVNPNTSRRKATRRRR